MEHDTPISDRSDANEAVLDNDMALRVQPRAPAATRYYFAEDGRWKVQKAGQIRAHPIDVDAVRRAVDQNASANDRRGGGGVKAVRKSAKDKYA